ncbi:MAG TPA: antibiotic biosynthesis monooxygenase [Burkholderiaceae bacterium]|jgi:heme-degrading monooxygenase HmoA
MVQRTKPDVAYSPPYYAVIFTSEKTDADADVSADYGRTADRMLELAAEQPGYLGVESVRDANGLGITVSYWRDLASIKAWRAHGEHTLAREQGRAQWYSSYRLRISKVEREYFWSAQEEA